MLQVRQNQPRLASWSFKGLNIRWDEEVDINLIINQLEE